VWTDIAEFEAELIRERVIAGVRRAKAKGKKLGRPRKSKVDAVRARVALEQGQSLRAVARMFGVHPTIVKRAVTPLLAG